jgi:hypothetical protein
VGEICLELGLKRQRRLRFNSILFVLGRGFELRAYMLAKQVLYCYIHKSSPFCCGYFGGRGISQTICPGWSQTKILLISA